MYLLRLTKVFARVSVYSRERDTDIVLGMEGWVSLILFIATIFSLLEMPEIFSYNKRNQHDFYVDSWIIYFCSCWYSQTHNNYAYHNFQTTGDK